MDTMQIVMISMGNALVAIVICFFGIKQKMAKQKAKHEAEIEKKRIDAQFALEQEKLRNKEQAERELRESKRPKFCSYCGSENDASDNYCDSCGSNLANAKRG